MSLVEKGLHSKLSSPTIQNKAVNIGRFYKHLSDNAEQHFPLSMDWAWTTIQLPRLSVVNRGPPENYLCSMMVGLLGGANLDKFTSSLTSRKDTSMPPKSSTQKLRHGQMGRGESWMKLIGLREYK